MSTKEIRVVFDGPPGHDAGRFVEVEDENGKSINVGEWVQRGNYWELRMPTAQVDDVKTTPNVDELYVVEIWTNARWEVTVACGFTKDDAVDQAKDFINDGLHVRVIKYQRIKYQRCVDFETQDVDHTDPVRIEAADLRIRLAKAEAELDEAARMLGEVLLFDRRPLPFVQEGTVAYGIKNVADQIDALRAEVRDLKHENARRDVTDALRVEAAKTK